MAFPTIPTTGNGRLLSQNQNNTTATRTFPSLSSLTKNSGDLLIAIAVAYQRSGSSATFDTWGGSFTERLDVDGGSGTTMAVGIATKVSTGSETGTFSVNQAAPTGHCALFLLSIAGWHGTTLPEYTALAVGTSAMADAAALDPSGWATEDTLWIAVAGNGETGTGGSWLGLGGTPVPPTNYGDVNSPGIGTDAIGGIHAAVAFRQNATGSEDADQWDGDVSNARNCALLIAIRPAASLVKTGGGTLEGKGAAADAFTATEVGSATAPRVGAASDAVIWARAGAGVLAVVASGVAELGGEPHEGVTYEKVGRGTLGLRSYEGAGVLGLAGGASDAFTATEAGSGTRVLVGSASDAVTFTESGAGVRGLTGSASDAATFAKTGAGIRGLTGSASDAVTFAKTGSGIRALVGAASDAVTFVEAGTGILSASGGGVAEKVAGGGAFDKNGVGIRDLAGSAADAVTFTEAGAGVLVRSTSAADAVTFVETGSGVRGFTASAADAVTFVEAGTGILARTAGGARESGGGTTYTKAAIGIMGVRYAGGATGSGVLGLSAGGVAEKISGATGKSGTGIRGLAASASDAAIWQRTGLLQRYEFSEPPSLDGDYPPSLTAVGSGASQKIAGGAAIEKTGTGTRGLVGAAADAVTFTESGAGSLVRSASATDAASFIETGAGVLGASGSGAAVRVSEGQKTGAGIRGFVGSAADAVTYAETGAGVLNRTGSASDTVTFTETGRGVLGASGGGSKTLEVGGTLKSGSGVRGFKATGSDAVTYAETGTGARGFVGYASDAVTFVRRGGATSSHTGGGTVVITFFDLPNWVESGFTATGGIEAGHASSDVLEGAVVGAGRLE